MITALSPAGGYGVSSVNSRSLLRALRLHLRQQLLNPIFLLNRRQAVFDVLGANFGLGLADGFVALDFILHAVEGGGFGTIADSGASVVSFADGAGAALLRNQQIGFALGLGQFLLELTQSGLQVLDLRSLVGDLLRKAASHLAITFHAMQRSAGQVVFFFGD